jgi:UDP-N-acetylmuramyl pentapeptide phosphotransferase/UDP-N-acetylglucosamine-1-phosphate transferase
MNLLFSLLIHFCILLFAAGLSTFLILIMMPLFRRYTLAVPNARSSHKQATPTGGGFAIILASLITFALLLSIQSILLKSAGPILIEGHQALNLPIDSKNSVFHACLAALILTCLGGVDDIRPLPTSGRLLIQAFAIGSVIILADHSFKIFPDSSPLWFERVVMVLAGLWFVNLVNFMDGLDWLSVGALVPMLVFCTLMLSTDQQRMTDFSVLALIILGALIGFAPYNKPVARLFLGDAGSLPLGFLTGWLLWQVAERWSIIAAILPALYYVSDATLTLLRRGIKGEKIWQAHRTHFYQRATDHGWTPLQISIHIFLLGCLLSGLGILAALSSFAVQMVFLITGMAVTGFVLKRFSTPIKSLS